MLKNTGLNQVDHEGNLWNLDGPNAGPNPYGPITFLIVGHGMSDIHHSIPTIPTEPVSHYNPTFEHTPNSIVHACPKNNNLRVYIQTKKVHYPFLRTACGLEGYPLDLIQKGHYVNPLICSNLKTQPYDGIYECRPEGPIRRFKFRNSHFYQLKDLVELLSSRFFFEKLVVVTCRGDENSEVFNVRGNQNWLEPIQTEPAEYIVCPSIPFSIMKKAMEYRKKELSNTISRTAYIPVLSETNAKRQKRMNHHKTASKNYSNAINRKVRSMKKKRREEKYGLTKRQKNRLSKKSSTKNLFKK